MSSCAASTSGSPALPEAQAFAFAPPAIPGIGTSGGATFMLEDRSGQGVEFLAQNTDRFLQAARQRPEFASLTTTFIPSVPQVFADVDRDKVLKQGVDLDSVYQTLQAFMGGLFVNYFNRFGRVWQVYVQAEGEFRTEAENVGLFRVRNNDGATSAALDARHDENDFGPGIHDTASTVTGRRKSTAFWRPATVPARAGRRWKRCLPKPCRGKWAIDYSGMSFQEQAAAQGRAGQRHLRVFAAVRVSDSCRAV